MVLSDTSALCQAIMQCVRFWADTDILFLSPSTKGFLSKMLVLLLFISPDKSCYLNVAQYFQHDFGMTANSFNAVFVLF